MNGGKRAADRNNKQAMFKICTSLTDCVRKINNTQIDNSKGPDVVKLRFIDNTNNAGIINVKEAVPLK